ncbi:MAG TPA: LytTR family DNA-binding domain-containing protein [Gammaproteobacteria bacterium]|nr:LytTR family DNA-binding domain-containing protein [Gammaproteobacteria bacterium]
MSDAVHDLKPATARRLFPWQMAFFALLLGAAAVSNAYSTVFDYARGGGYIDLWRPMVWESSSCFCLWLLIPAMTWWLGRYPLSGASWLKNLPAHLVATLPLSLAHVAGMVILRKLAYFAAGQSYDFGAWWPNWFYEYRKDLVAYWLIMGGLLAFRFYGLWMDAREAAAAETSATDTASRDTPLERLVVRKLNREFILDLGEVDQIEADGNYVVIHAGGQSYRLRESLEGLARRLDEQRFARVHRAHVVNIDRIREIQPWDNGDYRIVLKDGSFVNFSRRYRSRLNHLFN